jgi:lysozyme
MSRLKKGGAVAAAVIALVGAWEGVRTVAYKDVVGIPTVCFGETRGVKMGDRYTLDECKAMLGDGLAEFEAKMRSCSPGFTRAPDKVYVAMLSAAWNIGTGAFCGSTMRRKLDAGDWRGACNELPKWNRAGGRVVKGLVNRRADEQRICLEGAA